MKDFNIKFVNKFVHFPDDSVCRHTHRCHEIVYYTGEGETSIDGTNFRFFNNCVSFIPAKMSHEEKHTKTGTVTYFGFDTSEEDIGKLIPPGVYTPSQNLVESFEVIYKEAVGQYAFSNDILSARISEVVAYIMREAYLPSGDASGKKDISLIMNYLRENCHEKINLKQLSESFGFSYESFRKQFSLKYGISPGKFLVRERLTKARILLETGGISCTQAAMLCGFSDCAQFSRMFKEAFGTSPKKSKK